MLWFSETRKRKIKQTIGYKMNLVQLTYMKHKWSNQLTIVCTIVLLSCVFGNLFPRLRPKNVVVRALQLPCCAESGRQPACWWNPWAYRNLERRPWPDAGQCLLEPDMACHHCRLYTLLGTADTFQALPRIHHCMIRGLILTTGVWQPHYDVSVHMADVTMAA